MVEVVYHPANESENESIGSVFQLGKEGEAEYYSFLADWLAEEEPDLAEEFRKKAAAIRGPRILGYGLLIAVLAVVVLVAIVSLWRSLRKPKSIAIDTAGAEANPPPPSDGPTA